MTHPRTADEFTRAQMIRHLRVTPDYFKELLRRTRPPHRSAGRSRLYHIDTVPALRAQMSQRLRDRMTRAHADRIAPDELNLGQVMAHLAVMPILMRALTRRADVRPRRTRQRGRMVYAVEDVPRIIAQMTPRARERMRAAHAASDSISLEYFRQQNER